MNTLNKISLLALIVLLIAPAVPASAQRVSKGSIKRCEERVKILKAVPAEFDQFNKNHYLPPEDLSIYKIEAKEVMGEKIAGLRSASAKVPVYKKGEVSPNKVSKVNYHLVLERHRAAIANAKKIGVNTDAYNDRTVKLRDAVEQGIVLTNSQKSGISADGIDCKTKTGQQKAVSEMRERNSAHTQINQYLDNAKKASGDASREYTKVKREYNKKIRSDKR